MSIVSRETERWRAAAQQTEYKRPHSLLDRFWLDCTRVVGKLYLPSRKILKRAEKIEKLQCELDKFTEVELKAELNKTREIFRLNRQREADELTALALLGTACQRVKGILPYRVQYAGVLAMQKNTIIEMATGEGKSLVAALAGIIAGWYGRGCHVLTVNDYLAERDAQEMKELYEYCGCSVSAITGEMKPPERLVAYQADVTYCSEKEVVADYLRDNITVGGSRTLTQKLLACKRDKSMLGTKVLQRGLVRAVVDEADSVLIDRAVTPMIISKEVEGMIAAEVYSECSKFAASLEPETDYRLDMQYKSVVLLKQLQHTLKTKDVAGIMGRMLEDLVIQALQAKHFYKLDHDYIIDDGKVVLVDNSTGRLMRDHSWRGGVQQAVEAKEGLEVTAPKETCSRISFQRFFRLYEGISGMTGTAREARSEIWQEYRLQVVPVPPRRVCRRIFLPLQVCATKKEKWEAVLRDAEEVHRQGRPVLVGTRHVKDSEHLGASFKEAGLDCKVLNAVNHYEESDIVREAGRAGAITIATNMAGRGTDIKLEPGVEERGGLHVIATDMHGSQRVDRQLYGRCSRQGDRGSVRIILSWEDELVQVFCPLLTNIMVTVLGEGTSGEVKNTGLWMFLQNFVLLPFLPVRLLMRITPFKVLFDATCAKAVFKLAQHKSGRFLKTQRQMVCKQDYALSESLAFSGEGL